MQAFVQLFVLIVAFVEFSYSEEDWNYLDESAWPGYCQTGQQQSPINILTNYAMLDMKHEHIMGPLVYRGYSAVDVAAVNTGHTLQWDAVPGPAAELSGGPLAGNYSFVQLHLHWLSEHAIDGVKYPLEVHFVHVKNGLTFEEATVRPDGLAVIGVLANVQYGAGSSHAFEELIGAVPNIVDPAPSTPDSADIVDLTRLFSPDPQTYYTYQGSLTTPNCQESVTWMVMEKPIVISDAQYKVLTNVNVGSVNNYRSLQPSGRQVYKSTASSCASILAPSLALLSVLFHCAMYAMSSLTGFVKRGACFAANLKKRISGLKAIEC